MTLLLITLTVVTIVWITKNSTENIPTKEEIKEFKQSQIELLIDEYKYQEKLNNRNYILNIKLGLIYENLGRLTEAEKEYKKAVDKAPHGVFEPTFLLADLYTKLGRFNEALMLVGKIKEYPDSQLISSKAIFYSKIAEEMYEKKMYTDSIRQFLNSLYYQEKTTYKKTDVIKELPKVYIALADEYIREGKISRAMFVLAEGIRVTSSEELMYKLGVIGLNDDPENSLELFEEVAKKDPTLIDYKLYQQLLVNLIKKSEQNQNPILTKSYAQKLKLISRFADNNIVAPEDFKLEVLNVSYNKDIFRLREYADFSFVIRNNSSADVSKLYVQIKVYNNNKLIQTVEKRIATTYNLLRKGRATQDIRMKVRFSNKDEFIISPEVRVEVSIKRNERLKRIPLGEFSIPKN